MNSNFAICYNPEIENSQIIMKELEEILTKSNFSPEILSIYNLKNGFDFVFVIGGDGTILKASRFYSNYGTPIFGINLGHLGFLSQAGVNDLSHVVNEIISGNYKVEKRLMLEANKYNALNDIVIKGVEASRASVFRLEIDEKFVCEYFADGIIVSTPTGSTAYGMAAGGPVLAPDIEVLTVVPICPHTFAARPLVVNANCKIKIYTANEHKYFATADGQNIFSFKDEILINRSRCYASLVLLNQNDFYSVLRNKLNWGISPACNNCS